MKKVVLILALCLSLFGCEQQPDGKIVESNRDCVISTFGPKLFYFECTGNSFGLYFSKFADNNEVVSVTSDNRGTYGITIGYFVVIK